MLLTRDCLDIPESKDFSLLILPYVEQAERCIWNGRTNTEVSDDAKIIISYLLFVRLEEFLSHGPYSRYEKQPYYAEMEPLLPRLTEDYIRFIRELLVDFDADREKISGLLGRTWTKITGLLECGGDLHNHGRCTLAIDTDGGRLIYKPRECSIDEWFRGFTERYCDEYLYVPKVVIGKHCGYFEFVESKTPEVSQEEAFHYHSGQFCALVRMLGSVDLHRENILSYGSQLVPVDLETVLAPRERRDFFQFSTGKTYTPEEYERLQTSLRLSALLSFESDEKHSSTRPIDPGRMIHPQEAGFISEYRRIQEYGSSFAHELTRAANSRIRAVIRNTSQYDRMISCLFNGTGINGKDILSQLLSDTDPKSSAVCRYELEGLFRGDIPYFYTDAGSKHIFCDGALAVCDFFEMSAVQQAYHRLETAGEDDLQEELQLLRQHWTSN